MVILEFGGIDLSTALQLVQLCSCFGCVAGAAFKSMQHLSQYGISVSVVLTTILKPHCSHSYFLLRGGTMFQGVSECPKRL